MKISKSKTKISTIALVLLLSISGIISILPAVVAHDPAWTVPTYAFVSCSPPTVGVGQYTYIIMWLDKYPPTAGGLGGDRWRNFMLDITKPDGSTEQLGPFTSSTIGTQGTIYVPDQVGTYTIVFSWPGQVLGEGEGIPNNTGMDYVGDFFTEATSDPATLTVTSDPIEEWQEPPLPDYWERPIPTSNREWAQLASNWLQGSWLRYSNIQEFGTAPNSAHILWARPLIHGGIADELYGAVKYDTTDYENFFDAPIVMSGKLYYNAGTYPNYGYYKVDLTTGELDWYKNGTDNGLNNPVVMARPGGGGATGPQTAQSFPQLSFGQLFYYYSLNGEGVKDHLWMTQGSTWYMLDANTGNWVETLTNVPGGTTITDQSGSIVRYRYNRNTGQFLGWNLTQAIGPAGPVGTEEQQWEPMTGRTINAVNNTLWTEYGPDPDNARTPYYEDDILPRTGHTMNLTGPTGLSGSMSVIQDECKVPKLFVFSDFGTVPTHGGSTQNTFDIAVVSINENAVPMSPFPNKPASQNWNLGYTVTLDWEKTYTHPLDGNRTFYLGPISYEDKVFTIWCRESRQWWAYSLDNGALLWGPTASQPAWDMYGRGQSGADAYIAYGRLYSGNYGGVLHCYDLNNGNLEWTYTAAGIGYESPYGNYPIGRSGGAVIADGKVFLHSTEHSPTQPMWRGSYLRCIDAYTGVELWKSLNFLSDLPAVADGRIIAGNNYDNQIYCYGKGPSATTVQGPEAVQPLGTPVLIRGTVTDQSPGAKDTPAISEQYMDEWMDYLYMKQICPNNAEGVDVTLDTIDPNGNFIHIGTVTSDMSGMFSHMWTPEIEGKYTVIATFAGSDSYGSSYAETAIGVGPAVSAGGPIEPEEPAAALLISTELAIILAVVVIAVISVVAFWALRKRK